MMQRKLSKMRQKQVLFDQNLLLLSVPPSALTQNWGLSLIIDNEKRQPSQPFPVLHWSTLA